MKRTIAILAVVAIMGIAAYSLIAETGPETGIQTSDFETSENFEPSRLFDGLDGQADVIYLLANSSVIFGPDPNGRSEEITFAGLVTVPKWPMENFGRRTLPDGRQQIDIELVQSDLTGESYLMGGPIVLGEHPDLRSTGTITERPDFGKTRYALASNDSAQTRTSTDDDSSKSAADDSTDSATANANEDTTTADDGEEVPADFVVRRKVLLTTAKGVLYNETAVPVKGRVNSIPPVVFADTPTGVNVFRGMELPVALLDQTGNVNGWFYSKAHMAYAVKPNAVERGSVTGTVAIRVDGEVENVTVSGPVELHHGKPANSMRQETTIEVLVMALRGHSELLGGDIMISEGFSDRDRFSAGELVWYGEQGQSNFDLFVDVYTPSAKLYNREGFSLTGNVEGKGTVGSVGAGNLRLPLVSTSGKISGEGATGLFDESEQLAAEIVGVELQLKERT